MVLGRWINPFAGRMGWSVERLHRGMAQPPDGLQRDRRPLQLLLHPFRGPGKDLP
jgi:hypothetical protein